MGLKIPGQVETFHVPGPTGEVKVEVGYWTLTGQSHGWREAPLQQLAAEFRCTGEKLTACGVRPVPGKANGRVFVAEAVFEGYHTRADADARARPLRSVPVRLAGKEAEDLYTRGLAPNGDIRREWYLHLRQVVLERRVAVASKYASELHELDQAVPIFEPGQEAAA
jgi:hypothetical protein